jgi:choline kinase
LSSKISSREELLRKTLTDCERSGKISDPELMRTTIDRILSDAINEVEVVEFFYLQSLRKIMGQYDFTVVVIVTHNCVEFLENSKLYQYLGMRVVNAQRD